MQSLEKTPSQKSAFALVIALSLMAFVVLLLISITTLVQVETRSSETGQDLKQARQNALLGMQVALGELQKSAGPDQRTTTRAAIFDSNPETDEIDNVVNPHWVAVLPTVDPDNRNIGLERFAESNRNYALGFETTDLASGAQSPSSPQIRWLASMPGGVLNVPNGNPAQPLSESAEAMAGSGDEIVTIANLRSDGATIDQEIEVGKVPVRGQQEMRTGSFAWWVEDNGMKASFQLDDAAYDPGSATYSFEASAIDDTLYPLTQARRPNFSYAGNDGVSVPYNALIEDGKLSRIFNFSQTGLLDDTSEWQAWLDNRSADITVNSFGLPADVTAGRLKEDLTVYLETGNGLDPDDNILRGGSGDTAYDGPNYPVSFGGDNYLPKFGILESWNQLGKDIADQSVSSQPQTESQQGLHPIVKRVGMTFSMALAQEPTPLTLPPEPPDPSAPPVEYQANMHLLAFIRVELWNPHTVAIPAEKYLVEVALPQRVVMAETTIERDGRGNPYGKGGETMRDTYPSGTFPVEFDFLGDNIIQADNYAFGDGRAWVRMVIDTGDASLTTSGLQPGETILFSPAAAGNSSLNLTRYDDQPASAYSSSSNTNPAEAQDINPNGFLPIGFFIIGSPKLATFKDSKSLPAWNAAGGSSTPYYQVRYQTPAERNEGRLQHRLSLLTSGGPTLLSLTDPTRSIDFSRRNNNVWKGWDDFTESTVPDGARFGATGTSDFPRIYAGVGGNFANNRLLEGYADSWRTPSRRNFDALVYDRDMAGDRPMGLSNLRGGSLKPDLERGSWVNLWGYSHRSDRLPQSHRILPTGPNFFEVARRNPRWLPVVGPWGNEGAIEGTIALGFNAGQVNASTDSGTASAYFDFPRRYGPIHSVGQLMHAQLNMMPFGPSYQVGYSRAPYNIDRDRLSSTQGTDLNNELIDLSYMANASLWDRFYLSTIPQDSALDFSSGAPTLPNNRNTVYPDRAGNWPNPGNLQNNETAFRRSAANVLVEGSFNVNSTSVAAWEAFLLSKAGISLDYWRETPVTNPSLGWHSDYNISEDESFVAFPRVPDPILGVSSNSDFDQDLTSPQRTPFVRGGVHVTNRTEIRRLAEQIVEEIKRRGPALSMADFINRRLIPEASSLSADYMGLMGTLDAAIHRTSQEGTRNGTSGPDMLNHALIFDESPDNYSDLEPANSGEENLFATPQGTTDSSFEGFPGYLMQGDILANLGSSMSARSDTFTLHAYGEKTGLSGEVIARARCEAVVQRVAEPVDPGDDIIQPAGSFGRKFVVVSFRWLDQSPL